MDSSGEKITVSILQQPPDWSTIIDCTVTQPLRSDGVRQPKESLTKKLMEIVEQEGFEPMWNKIIVLACVIAVSLDPLFLYIPTINQEFKCFELDKKLRVFALVWRSIFDLIYIMDIIYNVTKAYKVGKREDLPSGGIMKIGIQLVKDGKISWYPIVVDLLSILPVPQVIILVQLSKLRGMGSLETRKYLNIILFSQYVPRILRIYISCKELTKNSDKLSGIVWVRGVFNLFLYILASHVFGAFWYFLSFQRETTCWHKACANDETCQSSTHSCDNREASRYVKILSFSCPIKPEDPDRFDFGIFLQALQSGVMAPNTDFLEKLFHCFWWGLRNMSSLGQNLQTSTNIWETVFAVSISLCGLLLFLYLIGNLQTYLQFATTKSEEIREKMKLKERDIELWISKNGLPKRLKRSIMKSVKYKLEENKDVDVENLFSILPVEERKTIKRQLCLSTIKKVPMLENMNEQVLRVICDHLKPVIYTENSYIIREGDPLDRMLFITQGTAWEYFYTNETIGGSTHSTTASSDFSTNGSLRSSTTRRIKKGDYFGEELVKWSLTHNTIFDFPISTTNLKSHTKVEAFALMANDLMNALRKHWWLFRRSLSPNSTNTCAEQWETLALQALQTIRHRNQLGKKHASSSQLGGPEDGKKWKKVRNRRLHH